jgi:hypothetical protein
MYLDLNLIRMLSRSQVDEKLIEQYLFEPASVAALVQAHADQLGTTVAAIVRDARISHNMVTMWRRGINAPNTATLRKLSETIGRMKQQKKRAENVDTQAVGAAWVPNI